MAKPPKGDSFNIRKDFVYLKENLVTNTTLIDELVALSVLSEEEIADYKDADNTKCGKLLKRILREGKDACEQFCTILNKPECRYVSLQNRQPVSAVGDDDTSFSRDVLKERRPLFLDELEPTEVADYLFQFSVFDLHIHDEIEDSVLRMDKTRLVLHHLESKSPKCFNIFLDVLKLSNQEHILSMLQEKEESTSMTPKQECVECVRINFRYIRKQLHFEITIDHLIQEGVLKGVSKTITDNRIQRGMLVKQSIRQGSRGCESLLKCLKSQNEETFEQALDTWRRRRGFDPRTQIGISISKTHLKQFEDFLISELEPLEMSDILFEENFLTVTEHDNIDSESRLKRRNQILLSCLKEKPDQLHLFAYALTQSKRGYILNTLKNPSKYEESKSDPLSSESQIYLKVDGGVPQMIPAGVISNVDLELRIEEKDDFSERVVRVINHDPNTRIECVQISHMELKHATTGSIVIHLCPLTDSAVHRFLKKDGTVVQDMVEKLFTSAGLHNLLKKREEIEIIVKVSVKESTAEEKESRSQNLDDITKRKIQKNETTLVDELEPSQLMAYLLQKKCITLEDKSEIDRERGRKRRGIKLLQKIRMSENKEILTYFIKYLQSVQRQDLVKMIQATEIDKDIHRRAEKYKKFLLPKWKEVVEDFETNIIHETFQKFKDIHALEDVIKSFLPESGKSRAERALDFLIFVCKHDEYVIELEDVLRKNNMDYLIPEEKMEEESVLEASSEETPVAAKPVEGDQVLFVSTYKVSFKKGQLAKGVLLGKESVEENVPLITKGDKELSSDTIPSKMMKMAQNPSDKTLPGIMDSSQFTTKGDQKTSASSRPLKFDICDSTLSVDEPIDEPMTEKIEAEKIVAAIDFGTTYSGFAFSLPRSSDSEVILQKWDPKTADKLEASLKTPTSLLLNDKNDFVAFGYEAEEMYKGYVEDKRHEQYRFFKNFKMKLHPEKLFESSMDIEDHLGKPLAALEVFSKSLDYMKEEVLKKLKCTVEEKEEYSDILISAENIHWIVTVPAIWNDFAKKFMREAAEKANIPSKQLTLALEPECAAIYVLTGAKLVAPSKQSDKTTCDPGDKFLVADLGGGTADFSVVEITDEHTLKHLHYASGGDWGGKNINENIFNIYEEIFGKDAMKKFSEEKADILEMENEIELKKRDLSREETLSLRLLPNLTASCPKPYKQMIEESKYKKSIKYKTGKIYLQESLVNFAIFKPVVGNIADHMKSILKEPNAVGIKTIILVGGFAKSNIVREYIKDTFSDTEVIIPTDPDLAVLKGAVKFGRFEGIIEKRVCDYTYGVETNRYPVGTDPSDKIKLVGNKNQCTQVFEKMITIGEQIGVNEKFEREFKVSTPGMKRMKINIYKSKEPYPLFITDKGCELFAEMTIEMPDTTGGMNRAVIICIQFGKTEITISAKDKNTGQGKIIRRAMVW